MSPVIRDISVNYPRDVEGLSRRSDYFHLALLQEELGYDYRSKPPKGLLDDAIRATQRYSIDDLIKAVDERDGPLMFELVLRCVATTRVISNGSRMIEFGPKNSRLLRWDRKHSAR